MNLQPPSVLLMGAPGAGKTDSLATLIEAGLEVFVIMTEPGGVESLLDSCTRRKLPIDKLHWTSVLPATGNWSALESMVTEISNKGYEDLQKIKSGVGKSETRAPAMKLLKALANFEDERTSTAFGDMSKWGNDRVLVLDSLSGLSLIAMACTIGFKPSAHQGEWGVAMNFVEQILLKLSSDRNCFFVLTAHVEKEGDEITGTSKIMASTLGRKLSPKIPRFFSEVVYAKRTIANNIPSFLWSTVDPMADLKNRSLPMSSTLPPTFLPIVNAYRARAKLAAGSPQPEAK